MATDVIASRGVHPAPVTDAQLLGGPEFGIKVADGAARAVEAGRKVSRVSRINRLVARIASPFLILTPFYFFS
jgi:hypothetical protein